MTPATLLGRLMAERGLHTHAEFLREYRRAAAAVGDRGAGPGPSRAQLHRWLTGRIAGLPQPHHRHVLEAMFPGRSVRQLLAAPPAAGLPPPPPAPGPSGSHPAGTPPAAPGGVRVYPDRGAFLAAHPVEPLLAGAHRVRAAGVSLALLGGVPAAALAAVAASGAVVECLLLDPAGAWSARRSVELGHAPAHLPGRVHGALDHLEQARRAAAATAGCDAADRIAVGLYDEPPRYALLLLDEHLAVVQAYLPHAPAVAAPVLLVDATCGGGRLFALYERLFDDLLDVSVSP